MLGVFAQELGAMLGSLSDTALGVVLRAAEGQPHRWLSPLRDQLADPRSPTSQQAATLLERIGEPGDILRLRDFSRRAKRSGQAWGYQLIERLAPRVRIDDLGLMKLQVGQRTIDGRDVRRRVLALVAFLATQGGSATPDQVLDALWPDLDPEQGSNSLHQTVYFLRRVIDPDYRAGYTAEYLHFDGDVIWLDRVLVDCRSWHCRRLLAQRPETPELVEDVLGAYAGKFAPEFAYEDWTAPYRDTLHAGVLSIMERAVSGNIGSPDLHWRLWVGQQVLSLDPEADAIEAQVIRLYRAIGAQAAAAEQYAHYSTLLRDQLGVDPPRIEDV
jgi:DNA-binding SARP family transcriptional activator